MKLLRETIRKLMLENQSHYDKIIALLVSNDTKFVIQGIELADVMGYFQQVHHKEYDADKVRPLQQEWLIKTTPAFQDRLRELYPDGVEHQDFEFPYNKFGLSGYVDLDDDSISIGRYKVPKP